MLVLTRGKGDSVCIGPGVTVTVTEVRGNRVVLGIKAPDGVKIMRNEIIGKATRYGKGGAT